MSELYDDDIVLWSERQAELLRRRAAGELVNEADLDWTNLAEEIEALGKSDARELANRITTILIHMIKLQSSAATEPRAGWISTILEQQDQIEMLLKDAPSLRKKVPDLIKARLSKARERALAEMAANSDKPVVDVSLIVFTADEVLGPSNSVSMPP
jgi:hypothetical protein